MLFNSALNQDSWAENSKAEYYSLKLSPQTALRWRVYRPRAYLPPHRWQRGMGHLGPVGTRVALLGDGIFAGSKGMTDMANQKDRDQPDQRKQGQGQQSQQTEKQNQPGQRQPGQQTDRENQQNAQQDPNRRQQGGSSGADDDGSREGEQRGQRGGQRSGGRDPEGREDIGQR